MGQTALLVMDMQAGILRALPDTSLLLKHTANAIAYARSKQLPVIYVRVGFRPGAPEINPSNKIFAASRERWANADPEMMMKIDPAITPREDEVIVTKRRVSAFTGSDLEVLLRAYGVTHMVLAGVATGGVVLSTLREAADKDYELTVLSDCCTDADPEIHHILTTKVFPRQATVITSDEWTKQ